VPLPTRAGDHIDSVKLLQAARDYAGAGASTSKAVAATDIEKAARAERSDEDADAYERHVKSLLTGWEFADLDKEAAEVRTKKLRVLGGSWKLYKLYDAVSSPPGGNSEEDWANHLETLKQWEAKEPTSVTPRIAMAQTYINYAWHVRGNGYANSVTNEEWREYYERIDAAAATLVEAAKLKEKCPVWFSTMQTVALAQGWDKQQARELYELASSFEPEMVTYSVKYAYYLEPKWYGEPGESEAVAEEAAKKLGEERGEIAYFFITSQLICTCESEKPPFPERLSWPKAQKGFEESARLYGASKQDLNDYALMAYAAGDKAAAEEAFAKIGEEWSAKTWWKQDYFKDAKAWAAGM
jgi:hypothetical protein